MRMFGKRPDLSKPVFQHPLSWLLISGTLAVFAFMSQARE